MAINSNPFDGLITTLVDAGRLKRLKRAGWVRVGIPEPESVADHSYRLGIMALLIGPRLGLNVDRMLRLALVHDLAEARVGDLTPADGVLPADKRAMEEAALAEIVTGLPEGSDVLDLWREYDAGQTPEAKIVRQLDKLEMALQALEYERGSGRDLTEFWQSARAAISEPLLAELFDRLLAMRVL